MIRAPKNYLFVFSTVTIIFISFIIIINKTIDNEHQFFSQTKVKDGGDLFKEYAQALLASKFGLTSIPARRFKYYLTQLTTADCYIVGSSHIMQFSIDTVPSLNKYCKKLLNLGVDASKIEDIVTMLGGIAQNSALPKNIFISIEPWIFKKLNEFRWLDYKSEYLGARKWFGLKEERESLAGNYLRFFGNLINFDYFVANLKTIIMSKTEEKTSPELYRPVLPPKQSEKNQINTQVTYNGMELYPQNVRVFLPDGAMVYEQGFSQARVNKPFDNDAGGSRLSWPYFDKEIIEEFTVITKYFSQKNVNLFFIITPFHPAVFKCTKKIICEVLNEVEILTNKIAVDVNAQVFGSYNPAKYNLHNEDFDDAEHISLSGISKFNFDLR